MQIPVYVCKVIAYDLPVYVLRVLSSTLQVFLVKEICSHSCWWEIFNLNFAIYALL